MEARWNSCHVPKGSSGSAVSVPSNLFTDENPATTIKGTGFKDYRTALRTIQLTSQRGVRYKQYFTIKAMRERAEHHPHQTADMREAMSVFDKWLLSYKEPNEEERKAQVAEWEQHHKLCASLANAHSYVGDDKEAMKRARADAKTGAACLLRSVTSSAKSLTFPLAAFIAVFGGPGMHGYGTHNVTDGVSHVVIESSDEFQAIVGKHKHLAAQPERVTVRYDRVSEIAIVELVHPANHRTLDSMLQRTVKSKPSDKEKKEAPEMKDAKASVAEEPAPVEPTTSSAAASCLWTCALCTLQHHGEEKRHFLVCSMCGAERLQQEDERIEVLASTLTHHSAASLPAVPTQVLTHSNNNNNNNNNPNTAAVSWAGLRPPPNQDIVGPRKRRRALDAPPGGS